jgi:CRISPR-associated protein Csm5
MAEADGRISRDITLEVLSPLHVGSGSGPLLADYDFALEGRVVWVMDQAKLLDRYDDEELRHGIPEVRLSQRLGPGRYAGCAAYSLPAPGTVGAEILPCVKSVEGYPYLPGSSLKGAIRGVLAWGACREGGLAPGPAELGPNPNYAAAQWERKVFGHTPNYDLMRALLVRDTGPVPLEQLELAQVSIYSLRGRELLSKGAGYRFCAEAFRPGTRLGCRLGVDRHLLNHPQLGLQERGSWLERLAPIARERAAELIAAEREFYAACGLRPLQQFYDRLKERAAGLKGNQFLLQMAWGTGWSAKTLGKALSGVGTFGELRDRYRLGRPGAVFPKSRRLVERGGVATEPTGWVEVTL